MSNHKMSVYHQFRITMNLQESERKKKKNDGLEERMSTG